MNTENMHLVAKKLTDHDRETLRTYADMAKGIGKVFGSCCEVTVHSLEDPWESLIYIEHGEITGRSVGSPLTDLGLELIEKSKSGTENVIGPYFSRTETGKKLRSVTVLIRNEKKDLIGFLCINLDISAPFDQFMEALLPSAQSDVQEKIVENFSHSVDDLVHSTFLSLQKKVSQMTGIAPIEKSRRIVQELQELGIFSIKGAVETVAVELGVSKFTIYNYLRDIKGRTEEEQKNA